MRILCYLFCVLLLFACKSNTKTTVPDSTNRIITTVAIGSIKPYALNEDYTVIDTGSYGDDGPMTGGHYAIITKNKSVVDTIDTYFGMKELADHIYLYQNVRSYRPDPNIKQEKGSLWGSTVDYVVIQGGHKTLASNLLPDFDNNFSSPSIIDKKVFYWHLNRVNNLGAIKVSAAQFDPVTKQTKRCYMYIDTLQTDNTAYFTPPYITHDTLYFESEKGKIKKFKRGFEPYN